MIFWCVGKATNKSFRFYQIIVPRCLECHASYFESFAPPTNRYTRSSLVLGIECEKCHGPGREHVAIYSSQSPPKPGAAKAIVNPASLGRNRQIDACALCHAGLGEPLAPALSFVPGDTLDKYLRIPKMDPDLPVDVHGDQVQLLERSRCFQASNMTCDTCHNIHDEQPDAGIQAGRSKPARPPRFPRGGAPQYPRPAIEAGPEKTETAERTQYTIVFTGTVDSLDKTVVEALLQHVKKFAKDTSITLLETGPGSIKIVLEGSSKGFKRLQQLFETGELTEILGLRVEDVVENLELTLVPVAVERQIHLIRGRRVMLDSDLAASYGVTTGALNQAVRRNVERFPDDFMLTLTSEEAKRLLSQTVMSKTGRGGRRGLPHAFTEHGVAMLSAVLKSERAIKVNIMIFRAFVRMRELIETDKEIAVRVKRLENSQDRTASVIEVLVEDIDRLEADVRQIKALPAPREPKIGFGV